MKALQCGFGSVLIQRKSVKKTLSSAQMFFYKCIEATELQREEILNCISQRPYINNLHNNFQPIKVRSCHICGTSCSVNVPNNQLAGVFS